MSNKTSQHILGTATNLLGFCLVVITSLQLTNRAEKTNIDELTSAVALVLTLSSGLSFYALRTDRPALGARFEKVAEYLFFAALVGIFGIILFILISYSGQAAN